jgi:hypothetical protein
MAKMKACIINADAVSTGAIRDLVSIHGVQTLCVRGAMSLPSKAPVAGARVRAPGVQLGDDDRPLREALDAGRDAGADVYLVISQPFQGDKAWTELLATDSGGRTAERVDPDAPVLCPSQPKLMEWLATAAADAAKAYRPTGILFEGFALGSPARLEHLYMCWCEVCRNRVEELGYDLDRIRVGMQGAHSKLEEVGRHLAELEDMGLTQVLEAVGYDTGLLDWLNFRADLVSACLYNQRQAVLSVDSAMRVAISGLAPTVALLAAQRRVDVLRDTTLADVYIPVIAGKASGLLETLAAHATLIQQTGDGLSEADAIARAAEVHGYASVALPGTIAALTECANPDLAAASARRELRLTTAVAGQTPQWPAIDPVGLPPGAAAAIAEQIDQSGADGMTFLGHEALLD